MLTLLREGAAHLAGLQHIVIGQLLVAVHVGKQDVDQHCFGSERGGLPQRVFASTCAARFQAGQRQEFGQQFRAHFIVVNQQDA